MSKLIAIVDDEPDIAELVAVNAKKAGFLPQTFADAQSFLSFLQNDLPDLVVLDLMLPGMDGLEICKTLKKDSRTEKIPIIMLTAKGQEADKIVGLELGADDYMTKPFSPRELVARIKAVLRRGQKKNADNVSEIFKSGDLLVDFGQIRVEIKGKSIELTLKEFEILKMLIQAKGRVLSRDHLLENVWGFDRAGDIETRTVDVHVRTLRRKLKSQAYRISTTRGYGYKFVFDQE